MINLLQLIQTANQAALHLNKDNLEIDNKATKEIIINKISKN